MSNTNDAYIAKINDIKPHNNADKLELAYIKGWQCVVGKGEFKPGDEVLFIQPDAQILLEPNDITVDVSWTEGIKTYLSKNGRVKIVTLRGEVSNGLIVKPEDVLYSFSKNCADRLKTLMASAGIPEEIYSKEAGEMETCAKELRLEMLRLASTLGVLDCALGIGHYNPPAPQDLSAKSIGMPPGVEKSDEENYQSLDEDELHLGEQCLATRKMDGSSGTIYYDPNTDTFDIYSRSQCLKQECDNNYTRAMMPLKEAVIALGKFYGEPIALRGEVCGNGMNANKANKDAKLPLSFYVYGVRFPQNSDPALRYGRWKSGRHFLDVVKKAAELGFADIHTVGPLGEFTITKELLKKWELAPAEEGEGVVVNGAWDTMAGSSSYKIKSAYYYAALK